MYMQDMETWDSTDSYYHRENFETEVYAGASHVRCQYPVTQMGNRTSLTGLLGDHTGQSETFTSATACGAQSWSASKIVSDSELSPPESPISLDDQQVLQCHVQLLICVHGHGVY